MKKALFISISAIVLVSVILNYPSVQKSVTDALLICGNSIIPSLFPVGFVATLLISSGAISSVSSRLSVYILFLISQTAGYPVGAILLNNSVKEGLMNKDDAKQISPALICAGPSFIISFVGEQLLNSRTVGIYIYFSQIIANLIVFMMLKGNRIKIKKSDNFSITSAFPRSVRSGSSSVMTVCSYIVLFFALKPVITKFLGVNISKIIIYFSEVSSAVLTSTNIYITCGIIAFGGICVLLQIMSISENIDFSAIRIIKWRFICIIISCLTLKILLTVFPIKSAVFSNITEKPILSFGGSIGFVTVFLFSIFVMLLSFRKKTEGKIVKDIL